MEHWLRQSNKTLGIKRDLAGCDLMGLHIGTTCSTIQPMKAKREHIKDPCDLPLCTHLGYAFLHTIRHRDIPRTLFILEQLKQSSVINYRINLYKRMQLFIKNMNYYPTEQGSLKY